MVAYFGEPDESWFVNQEVEIIDGPFVGFRGVIYFIDRRKRIVRVKVDFWTRDTPVELNFTQIRPLDQT